MAPVLSLSGLEVTFAVGDKSVRAVKGVSFDVGPGEVLAIVGESGSGKSQAALSLLGLLAGNATRRGKAIFGDQDLLTMSEKALDQVRGREIAMVFQDPMTTLNPYLRISTQMTEVLRQHRGLGKQAAREEAIAMLERVRIPQARERFDSYPHSFSGGMRQRVIIAMALLCSPRLLIADEPTTALDVTVQAEILDVLDELRHEMGTAIILITHDMGVVASIADRVGVMYDGRIVEIGTAQGVLADPQHPYTVGLLESAPRLDGPIGETMTAIPGNPPARGDAIEGCAFAPRCPHAFDQCRTRPPLVPTASGHEVACHLFSAEAVA